MQALSERSLGPFPWGGRYWNSGEPEYAKGLQPQNQRLDLANALIRSSGLTFRRSLNAFPRNFLAVGSSGLARGFQVDEALGLLLPGSHELLDLALVVDGLLQ
jgi:hypothetical protein